MSKYNPSRTEQRRLLRHFTWLAQGKKCKICETENQEDEGIIEHANGNPSDYRPENIGWVCYSCNQRKKPENVLSGELPSGHNVCVNPSARADLNEYLSLQKASRELQISEREDLFRVFLWENVGREGELTVDEAIAEGAEYCDVSPYTIEARWLKRAVSKLGPFRTAKAASGTSHTLIIKLRDDWKPPNNERGRKDYELMLQRKKRELENVEQAIADKVNRFVNKEAFDSKCREVEELRRKLREAGKDPAT